MLKEPAASFCDLLRQADHKMRLPVPIIYTLTVVCFLVVRKMICPSTMTL